MTTVTVSASQPKRMRADLVHLSERSFLRGIG
jgi:hypothetical protein